MDTKPVAERRVEARTPRQVGAQIFSSGELLARGATVDVSTHGMRLDLLHDLTSGRIDVGRNLYVMLDDTEGSPDNRWRLIKVVHRHDGWLGARFLDLAFLQRIARMKAQP